MLYLKLSLIIIFIHACFQEGMIFAPIRRDIDDIFPEFIQKPLYACIVCMSGIYVTALWLLFYKKALSIDMLEAIAVVGGINAVLGPFVDLTIFEIQRKMTNKP